ncbi:Anr2p ASCRUDRAFT_74199 [Ascoidea rubescens DSM 1968]|uniref:Uncharacterized protein n=1 Tax=Ascoidea rubescens DSM 1968 TaxID=1344418 RepID=A0A1D2VMD8_9ASCO|nr:hypothetical protein ASCRUDRAFT_74199 [Ascoidea rubescens DSM 1968]ODV62715.1 hypothetical protein ASCRUDRAFT_74199 [Ascoidea rubescens DSM 1968]
MASSSLSSVRAVFLVEFDVKIGYELKWSYQFNHHNPIDLSNIEFKSLPSGLHDYSNCFFKFKHYDSKSAKFYDSITNFQQNGFKINNTNRANRLRDEIKMFSLGLLLDEKTISSDNHDHGWNYSELLNTHLSAYINNSQFDDYAVFKINLINDLKNNNSIITTNIIDVDSNINSNKHNKSTHKNNATNINLNSLSSLSGLTHNEVEYLLQMFGPSLLKILRYSILGKNILIKNNISNLLSLNSDLSLNSNLSINSNSIPQVENNSKLITLISILLSKIYPIFDQDANSNRFIKKHKTTSLYNISLHDLSWLKKFSLKKNFIASSSDDIIFENYKKYNIDIVIEFKVVFQKNYYIYPIINYYNNHKVSNANILRKIKASNVDLDDFIYLNNNYPLKSWNLSTNHLSILQHLERLFKQLIPFKNIDIYSNHNNNISTTTTTTTINNNNNNNNNNSPENTHLNYDGLNTTSQTNLLNYSFLSTSDSFANKSNFTLSSLSFTDRNLDTIYSNENDTVNEDESDNIKNNSSERSIDENLIPLLLQKYELIFNYLNILSSSKLFTKSKDPRKISYKDIRRLKLDIYDSDDCYFLLKFIKANFKEKKVEISSCFDLFSCWVL